MKIAFYAPLKPISHPTPSGDREIARSVYRYFQSRGAEVFVLSEFRTRWFFRSPSGWLRWLGALARAYRRAKAEKPDVFFTYHLYYKAPDPIAFVLAWWFGKPYFVFEGMYARKAARRPGRWSGYLLTRAALRYATRIFSDKTEDYRFLSEWFPEAKLVYLPPSVDLAKYLPDAGARERFRERYGIGPEEIVIATVAMLRPDRKSEGVKFLLDCLEELRGEGLLFRWVHAGGGACFEEVRSYARGGLGPRAQLLGSVEQGEVAELLRAADIFAFPGIDEGFGLVYVEAQAAGLPVVAFDNGGIPDAVEKDTSGFLTPLLDKEAHKKALRTLLRDPLTRKRMSERARAFSRKFDAARNYGEIWSAMEAAVPEVVGRNNEFKPL